MYKKEHFKTLILIFICNLTFTLNAQISNFPPERSGQFKTYTSRDSINFNIGTKLEIGLPYSGNLFSFITQGIEPAASHISGRTVTVHQLKSVGNNKTGYKMYAMVKGFGLVPVAIDIEQALRVEEIFIIE